MRIGSVATIGFAVAVLCIPSSGFAQALPETVT